MPIINVDQVEESLPDVFPVAVIMQQSPSASAWVDDSWEAVGILAGSDGLAGADQSVEKISERDGVKRFLHRGFTLTLHVDECESYYHNLMSPSPHCYVVASLEENDVPVPMLVSLSFDEAHAYLEGDETLYVVPLPAEIYRWTEAFVLCHYVPEKRTKRKRRDWTSREEDNSHEV